MSKKTQVTALPKAAKISGELLAVAALALVLTAPLRGQNQLSYIPGSQQLARTTTTQVVSGDMTFGGKPAASDIESLQIPVLTGKWSGKMMYWDQPVLEAVSVRSDGSKIPVPADWYIKDISKEQLIENCSLVTQCKIDFSQISDGSFITLIIKHQGHEGKKGTQIIGKRYVTNTQNESPVYNDEIPDWARASIEDVGRLGLMTGYEDGRFGAADQVTNAQFATMLSRLIDYLYPSLKNTQCTAIALPAQLKDHYAAPAFCKFASKAWDISWAVEPEKPITRAGVARMITENLAEDLLWDEVRYLFGDSKKWDDIWLASDVGKDHPNQRAVSTMIIMQIMGEENQPFRPDDQLNRAEAATIINRSLRQFLSTIYH